MRIDDIGARTVTTIGEKGSPASLRSGGANAGDAANAIPRGDAAAHVHVSEQALASSHKVDALRSAVQHGTYVVNAHAIASKIVGDNGS